MRRFLQLAICLLALAASQGCVSRLWTSAGVNGRVVDDVSGEPIADADVRLIARDVDAIVGRSDQRGYFSVPASSKIVVSFPLLSGDWAFPAKLVVLKEEYEEASVSCSTITGEVVQEESPVRADIVVRMKRTKQKAAQPGATDNPGDAQ